MTAVPAFRSILVLFITPNAETEHLIEDRFLSKLPAILRWWKGKKVLIARALSYATDSDAYTAT